MAFELTYGYFHCVGRTLYIGGVVQTEDEAEQWVRDNRMDLGSKIIVPENDPVRTCPVRHCHMKLQRPWFSYRKKE